MFKSLFVGLFTLACAVSAKTSNWPPGYAVMAIDHKWKLYLLETALTAVELPAWVQKLQPVKNTMYEQFASGDADLTVVYNELNKFIDSIEAEQKGFREALLGFYNKNILPIESIADPSPEESWDFLYYSFDKAAETTKKDKIDAALQELNNEFEPLFKKAPVDTKAMVGKIDKFLLAADAVDPTFSTLFSGVISVELDEYDANLKRVQRGEKPVTEAPVLDAGSTTEETDKPSASGNETETETETATPTEPTSTGTTTTTTSTPEATTAPVPATTSAATGRVSSMIAVGVSVFATAVSYLTL